MFFPPSSWIFLECSSSDIALSSLATCLHLLAFSLDLLDSLALADFLLIDAVVVTSTLYLTSILIFVDLCSSWETGH